MKLITGLFRFARKRIQTTDNDMGMFREKLNELVSKKDELSDEEIGTRVEELKAVSADLPDGEEKEKLVRFLEDFKAIKEQDGAVAGEAASMVADLFEKLDTEAMKDAPQIANEPPAEGGEPAPAEPNNGEPAPAGNGGEPAPAGTHDDEGNANYTLEEIYQFIKKRMAEDCATKDGDEQVEEEKDKEVITKDNAPRIPVTLGNNSAAKGSLAEMFEQIKKGGR